MPIKDKEKRREYQRELMRQKRAKMLDPNQGLTKKVSPNVRPDNFVSPSLVSPVSPNPQMLDPNLNVSPKMLDQEQVVSPKKKLLDPVRPIENVSPCSRCPGIENSISEFANLYQQEQEKVKELIKEKKELLKDLEVDKQTIKELTNQNQAREQKYTRLENTSKNKDNSLSIVDLNNLISKYERLRNIQHRYSSEEVRELRLIKELYEKLWPLVGLVP